MDAAAPLAVGDTHGLDRRRTFELPIKEQQMRIFRIRRTRAAHRLATQPLVAFTALIAITAAGVTIQPVAAHAQETGKAMTTTTASGLQINDTVEGTGASPKTGQTCVMHYTGWLYQDGVKGKKFDSSVDRGQPFEFTIGVGQVIKGWDEGVLTMKVGGKRSLIIPAALGYGARGAGGVIPPNATLLFDVELLGVKG
jgi:peptidylprolyl isomerase